LRQFYNSFTVNCK